MRKLAVLLMLLVAVSFAGSALSELSSDTNTETTSTGYVAPMPMGKAILFDHAYDGTCDQAHLSSGLWRQADDFTPTNPGRIESLEWWSLYLVTPGADFNLRIYDDDGGTPGTILWEVAAVTPTDTDTGDDFNSYNIYHTVVTLDPTDYFPLEDGTTYWLSTYWSSDYFYWAVWDNGNMVSSYDGGAWDDNLYDAMFRLNGTVGDFIAPEVSGQDPADGASGIAVTSDIVFHVTDAIEGVNISTINFSVEDSAKSGEATVSLSNRGSTGAITGTLVADAANPNDVICTFTPDSDLPPDTITCTVAAGLADTVGNATTTDIVWSFDTTGSSVEETTWGQIKAL